MGPQGLLFALRGYLGAVFHCRNNCRAAACRAKVRGAGKVGAGPGEKVNERDRMVAPRWGQAIL